MPLEYLPNLGCRFPTNLVAAMFKLGDRQAFERRQFFLHFLVFYDAVIRHGNASFYLPKGIILQCRFQYAVAIRRTHKTNVSSQAAPNRNLSYMWPLRSFAEGVQSTYLQRKPSRRVPAPKGGQPKTEKGHWPNWLHQWLIEKDVGGPMLDLKSPPAESHERS